MKKKRKKKKFDLTLRPHHVDGYAGHELYPEYYHLSDKEYLARWREMKGHVHSDKLVIHWRETIKKLHENPDLKFKYVPSIDSVCRECNLKKKCHDPEHEYYKFVEQIDKEAIEKFPELKFGKSYTVHYLNKLIKKKKKILLKEK